jgi:hypothetical protein
VCLGEGGSVRGSTNVIAALGDKDVCALAGHRDALKLFEIAFAFVRLDHVSYEIIGFARVSDCLRDCLRRLIPQPTEWKRIGNQIDAAMIFARADCVNMHRGWLQHMVSRDAVIALICPPPVLTAFFL